MSLLRRPQKILALLSQGKNREIQRLSGSPSGSNEEKYREGIRQYVEEIKRCTVEIEVRLSMSRAVLVDLPTLIEFASRRDLLGTAKRSGTFTNTEKVHT